MKSSITVFIGLVLLAAAAAQATTLTAVAVRVHDGDTITARASGRTFQVRLAAIDAPELAQDWGTSSAIALRSTLAATTFTLVIRSQDRYGRFVGTLILPSGENVNERLVAQGLAWWYTAYDRKNPRMAAFQNQARDHRIGLWTDQSPTPPWQWRKQHKPRKSN